MKKYDNYKDSGIEWLGEIPEHWESIKLKYIISIQSGKGITNEQFIENGEFDIYGGNGVLGKTDSYTNDGLDLIIGRVGALCGNIRLVYGKKWISDNALSANTTQNHYFIEKCLKVLDLNRLANKNAQPLITGTMVKDQYIGLPSIQEQTVIANYLDHKTTQIDTLIAKKEQFICLLQEERTAVINQAVTKGLDPKVKMKDSGIEWLGEIPEHWKLMRVGSLSQCITGFAFKSDNFSFENGIKIVRGDNVTENSLRWGDKTRYWNEYSEVLDRFQLQKNDIVIGMDGSKVGKNYAYVEEKDLPLLLVQRVARIRSNSELIAKWIHFNIGTYNFKYYINLSKTDPAIPHITLKNITSYPICIPDINELNLIIEKLNSKLEKLDETLKKSQQEIELLKEYKTALISEVVTGKVDVRDVILN